MSISSSARLAELVEHNQRMLQYAQAGNWEKLAECEITRQQMIRAFYSSGFDIMDITAISNTTRELLLVNEELTKLVCDARDQAQEFMTDLGKGKAAINAYTRNMR